MKGQDVWMRIFNTDFEEAVLAEIDETRNFEDQGTPEQNAKIIEKLDAYDYTFGELFDIYFSYYSCNGMSFDTLKDLFDMLQIENWNEVKDEYEEPIDNRYNNSF